MEETEPAAMAALSSGMEEERMSWETAMRRASGKAARAFWNGEKSSSRRRGVGSGGAAKVAVVERVKARARRVGSMGGW